MNGIHQNTAPYVLPDQCVLRIVAAFIAPMALAAMVAGPLVAPWILLVLAVDFALRGFGRSGSSPLSALACALACRLELEPASVERGPRRFAARFGVLLVLAAATLYVLGFIVLGTVAVGTLVICAALEATFSVCVPSKIHSLLPERLASALAR
jgi:uncharacterized membrane protein YczE